MNISGGNVGNNFVTAGVVNISGGTVGDSFTAESGSVVNISGGIIGDNFSAISGSEVNLFGSQFFLDGVELDLLPGQTFSISSRDELLSGVFANGDPFSFQLNTNSPFGGNPLAGVSSVFFSPTATLTVTLDSSVLLGDVNLDGVVDFFDIQPFIDSAAQAFQAEADIDGNGVVDFFDIAPFIALLSGQ